MSAAASLQLGLNQQLQMTPDLQQSMQILQLSNADLNEQIKDHLSHNIFLNAQYPSYEFNPDLIAKNNTPSIQQHLLDQLELLSINESEMEIALTIIDLLDKDGLLRASNQEITNELPEPYRHAAALIPSVLSKLQRFDPAGICARNIQECLLIQLNQLEHNTPYRNIAIDLVKQHMSLLVKGDQATLMAALSLSSSDLVTTLKLIRSMNPRPAAQFQQTEAQHIIPEAVLKNTGGHWKAEFNKTHTPKLSINQDSIDLFKKADNSPEKKALNKQLIKARSLINAIEFREQTIVRMINCISDYQQRFFDRGNIAMQPMIGKDLASVLNVHASTISRAANSKFIQTPQGTLPISYFFSSIITNKDGQQFSSIAIKAIIKTLSSNHESISDNKIRIQLQQQGINIARRTVTKYRHSNSHMLPSK